MKSTARRLFAVALAAVASGVVGVADPVAAMPVAVKEIVDYDGAGVGKRLEGTSDVVVDGNGTAFVSAILSDNVLRVSRSGVVTEIIDEAGDHAGHALQFPIALALDSAGNVYVVGQSSANVFRITPDGTITQIIDASGDGMGATVFSPTDIVIDSMDNVYVPSFDRFVLRITPSGVISKVMDIMGDGQGNLLIEPAALAIDSNDNLYVADSNQDHVFRVTPQGVITKIIDATGDGLGNVLEAPLGLVVGPGDILYVTGFGSDNAFSVTPGDVITEIYATSLPNRYPVSVAVDSQSNVYVAETAGYRVTRIDPLGATSTYLDSTGDGLGNLLELPSALFMGPNDQLYVTGDVSDNAFRLSVFAVPVPSSDTPGLVALALALATFGLWSVRTTAEA